MGILDYFLSTIQHHVLVDHKHAGFAVAWLYKYTGIDHFMPSSV